MCRVLVMQQVFRVSVDVSDASSLAIMEQGVCRGWITRNKMLSMGVGIKRTPQLLLRESQIRQSISSKSTFKAPEQLHFLGI